MKKPEPNIAIVVLTAMKVTCSSLNIAISQHEALWQTLRSGGEGLDSPFFSPRFYQAVQSVGRPIEVATVCVDDQTAALWPFERVGARAIPTAASICEITGPIASPRLDWNPKAVLRQCGLRQWVFDCSPASQVAFRPYHVCERPFPVIDLSRGWQAYQSELRSRGASVLWQVGRKSRRLAREHAEPHFVFDDKNPHALDCLIRWKREQYRRTGVQDVMQPDWFATLLRRLHQTEDDDLKGLLSTLYLGDQPIAVHFGIRSGKVLAWWFPAYDPDYGSYSPGSTLLVKLLEAAETAGISRVDLGQGDERYKGSFSNASFTVAEGVVSRRPWSRFARKTWVGARDWAQTNPRCDSALRIFRKLRGWSACR